ncbi:MAG TPA: hypothetical protein VGN00_24695 [Puia sp.]|jgi:hypothetical protein
MNYAIKATKERHKDLQPMPDKHETIPIDWKYTPDEFGRIGMGDIPWEFGDKRFSYLEDNCLYIHEFLGRCLFIVSFEDRGDHLFAWQLQLNSFGASSGLNNPEYHLGVVRQYVNNRLVRGNMHAMLEDSDIVREQVRAAINDKDYPLPVEPLSTDKVYQSAHGGADLRFIIKIDRYSNLYIEYYLMKGDMCIRKRIDRDGKQTDVGVDELDPRLTEVSVTV